MSWLIFTLLTSFLAALYAYLFLSSRHLHTQSTSRPVEALRLRTAGVTERGHRTGDPVFDREVSLVGAPLDLLRLDAPTRDLLRRFFARGGTLMEGQVLLPYTYRWRREQRARRALLYGIEAALTREVQPYDVVALLRDPIADVGLRAMRLLLDNPDLPGRDTVFEAYCRHCGVEAEPEALLPQLTTFPAPLGLWVLHHIAQDGALAQVPALQGLLSHALLGTAAGQALASIRLRHAHAQEGGLTLCVVVPVGGLSAASLPGQLDLAGSPKPSLG